VASGSTGGEEGRETFFLKELLPFLLSSC